MQDHSMPTDELRNQILKKFKVGKGHAQSFENPHCKDEVEIVALTISMSKTAPEPEYSNKSRTIELAHLPSNFSRYCKASKVLHVNHAKLLEGFKMYINTGGNACKYRNP